MVSKAIRKRIVSPILQRFTKYYFSKPRPYSYKQIKGTVLPGVFYPFFTISTRLLLEFIDTLSLENKSFLELGCGTGFISVLAAQKGAKVIASDINPKAVENVQLNAQKNQVNVEAVLSDLFEHIPKKQFDFIMINPPYYSKRPKNVSEKAWFCGEKFEYFHNLFSQLGIYFGENSKTIMILSEDCAISEIQAIALQNNIVFELMKKQKVSGEENFLFKLSKKAH